MPADQVFTILSTRVRKPNGWGVWETDRGTIKGTIPWEPSQGELLSLSGVWETSRFTGKPEFALTSARVHIETDPRALLHYACTISYGLGPAREDEIWLLYGENWQQARDLTGLSGLSRAVVPEWQLTLDRIQIERARFDAVSWLIAHGCTDNLACAAFARWEEQTIPTIQADPYRLAELPRYGFVSIDAAVAPAFGIGRDDPRRHRAALRYALAEHIGQTGDSCPLVATIQLATREWMDEAEFDAALAAEVDAGTIERAGAHHVSTPVLRGAESVIWAFAQGNE